MEFLLAIIFGAAAGVVLAYGTTPDYRWPLYASATLLTIIGVVVVAWTPFGLPILAPLIVLSMVLSRALVSAQLWKRHPLLQGSSYGYRVWASMWHDRKLRHTPSERQRIYHY